MVRAHTGRFDGHAMVVLRQTNGKRGSDVEWRISHQALLHMLGAMEAERRIRIGNGR